MTSLKNFFSKVLNGRVLVSRRVTSISQICYNIKELKFQLEKNHFLKPEIDKNSINLQKIYLKIKAKVISLIKIFPKLKFTSNSKFRIFHKEFKQFLVLSKSSQKRFDLSWEDRYPCVHDKIAFSGFDTHYIYHIAWAARILSKIQPKSHIDISSSLYFSTMLSAFIPTEFYDFHKADITLSNLKAGTTDLLTLQFSTNSIESLSCMHVIEHIGLGRYGDLLDYDGDLKAMKELKRVFKIRWYFVIGGANW